MEIGVLALQGGFYAHVKALEAVGVQARLVKKPTDLDSLAGLILPGGESTTQIHFIRKYEFTDPLDEFHRQRRPIFGTCAGVILLAREVRDPTQYSLKYLDVAVTRNAYGSQKESFEEELEVEGLATPGSKSQTRGVFIRAPQMEDLGPNVEVLSQFQDKPVLVRQGHILGASFHPELTEDTRLHQHFVETCRRQYETL